MFALFHGMNGKSTTQMNVFYYDANSELIKRAILHRLKKHTDLFVTKKKRDRETLVHELAKEYIASFQSLSKGSFKKIGKDFVTDNFKDVVSDFAVKEIIKKREKQKARSPESRAVSPAPPAKAQDPMEAAELQSNESDPLEISGEHKQEDLGSPLSSMKSQILNIPHFMKAYESCEEQIAKKKADLLSLEYKRNEILVEIQSVNDDMVASPHAAESEARHERPPD